MKHQGKHLDSGTLAQVGPKFTDGSQLNEKGNNTSIINSNELLARQVGESVAQIKRYIMLTKLIPKILDMVDDGKIAFTIAVELSYLSEDEQYELYAVIDLEQCTPSLSQANRMKRISQSGKRDIDEIYSILEEEKPNQREQIKIRASTLEEYFLDDFTPKQKVELIERLVKEWYEKQIKDKYNRIMLAAVGVEEKVLDIVPAEGRNIEDKTYPTMLPLAEKYPSLQDIYDELQKQNEEIFVQEHKRSELEIELSECNGAFKAREREELQKQIYELDKQIDNMKRYLSSVVQRHRYDNVKEFYSAYYSAKGEYADYMKEVEEWKVNHGNKNENISTEENRTDRYQIGEELDENGYIDRKYVEKKT